MLSIAWDPCQRVYAALLARGLSPTRAAILTAIARAESGCRSEATNVTQREYSVGPFQINLRAHPWVTEECARDYWCSAGAALEIERRQGLGAWSVFRDQSFRRFLPPSLQQIWATLEPPPVLREKLSIAPDEVQAPPELKRQVLVATAVVLVVVAASVLMRRRR